MLDNKCSDAAALAVPNRNASEAAIHEAWQRFIATFSHQCDSMVTLIEAVAELGVDGPIDSLRRILHNLAGHAGGIGFPKVSAGAAAIEALIADVLPGEFDARRARELVAALRDDFATDLVAGPTDATNDPRRSAATGKILVVDDDAHAREGLTEYLIAMGYSAIGLPAADSLLAVARTERPDLILLDIGLPGIDGFAACRLLKTEPALSDIPVIFLTAHTDIDNRLTAFALGAEDFLSKPVDVREVRLRIQIQISRRRVPPGVSRAGDDLPRRDVTVVLADDDPEVTRLIDSHLRASGYRTVIAFDGAQAMAAVETHRPDVLVLDLMLPKMSGFDVLDELRRRGDGPHVVVLSGLGREEDVMRAFAAGAADYMSKPFNVTELLVRIGRLAQLALND
jgi:DNA-binding response OmpR family regulator